MQEVPQAGSETVEVVDGVHLTQMAAGESMSVQHFHIEGGAVVPEHSHPHEQVGYVVRGTATFEIDGDEFVIGPGDSYAIPGDEPHRVENRTDEPIHGIDVFSPPRTDADWQD